MHEQFSMVTSWSILDQPRLTHGIAFGEVSTDRARIWARSDRPSLMHVEWDTSPAFPAPRLARGALALPSTDFTARLDLRGLPSDRDIFVRTCFESLDNPRARSEPVAGSFRTAPARHGDLRVVWSGDTAGQGYGINPDIGGMRSYEAMRARRPDLFIHCGDTIYADGPLPREKIVESGQRWRNIVTPEKSKVAETLAEFRGNFRYNLLDDNVRRFNAQVPQLWLWDDHEVCNNWSSSKDLSATRAYVEKNVATLAARARRAFLEYAPSRFSADGESERVYRRISYGPLLDVFALDMRAYRGPNTHNLQAARGRDTDFLGRPQLRWLEHGLATSRATWKLIAADMPLGLCVPDGTDREGRPRYDGISNGDGPVRGRELELAELLRFIKRERIRNVVWITADVHYTAAHYYDPAHASFTDFEPFWEFVSGPLNAGAFGPTPPDDTFGLQVVYQKTPPQLNYSPLSDYQFFGEVNVSARERTLAVTLRDVGGHALFERTLEPQS
jgi:alkaline phosphatase D